MSKPVKEMIMAEYKRRFEDLEGALVLDIRGIDANDNNALRLGLADKNIRVTILKNTLARKAFAGTRLEAIKPALEGPSALAYGAESVVEVARELVDWAKKVADLDLKGAVLDGEFFGGEDGVKRLSTFPTREEAQAKVVQLIISPAGKVTGAATAPGARLLGIVKEIQNRLEQGETIAKVG
ncbi:MAG: 50S ribosomal protein L10 [Phycisphaerales bacterium]|nr:MAG: 50S ribosomal protein L10 [Phycisphaerales bacterium]